MGLIFNNYKYSQVPEPSSVNIKHLPRTNQLTVSNRLFLQSLGYNVANNVRYIPKTPIRRNSAKNRN